MPKINARFFRDAWELTRPYWTSEERRRAWLLSIGIVVLNLFQVYLTVWLNQWYGTFYNALQDYDRALFFRELWMFCGFAIVYLSTALLTFYITQMLQISWRRWLTGRYITRWLANNAYYRMQLAGDTDNPDQRIADDLRLFTDQVLNLSVGLLSSVVTFFSFIFILWTLSGPLTVPLGALGSITIPGYAAIGAILYAAIGTWATVRIGRPLIGLTFNQQRFEADFRYSLVRLRENSESIAFYKGEPHETHVLDMRFSNVFANFIALLKRRMQLIIMTSGYSQIAIIVPYLVAAPKYFGKAIQFGGVQQIANSFDQVQTSLSFIVNSYSDIAELQAVMSRLTQFEHRARELESFKPSIEVEPEPGGGLTIVGLDLDLPNGAPLRAGLHLDVPPSSSLLIMGPTGAGKSTLLRAISGLWPFGHGRIATSAKHPLFLPQKPYIPLCTLRDAMLYPYRPAEVQDAEVAASLKAVGLERLTAELDAEDNWAQRLSVGEQQRLAFARVLIQKPDMIFLDEATAALDEASEAELYRLIEAMPEKPTIVSVGHRSTLKSLHDTVFEMGEPAAALA
ncbi:ATP-binding cassette domain-containing protein [Parvibaculum sedimenti]|uniref:ATP-binding cassette domain-containing protein n=1 Tax=Parvibaculum sedimenti TaxID=2608632 RepID=A0A6N6VID3_9HYPH|nr:ABC transporter ATP-binding protein/permease [Parvibaculum sedimenti]KAB7740826.1 ATP-binding cassette domain-containing protein [Parvibaculum sedimenti]